MYHYSAELLSLHRGQGLELLWRDSLQCPTEAEYITMVNNSTQRTHNMCYSLALTGAHLRDGWSVQGCSETHDGLRNAEYGRVGV